MGHTDPFDISSQEHARAQAAQRAQLESQLEIDDVKWLMSNRRGRRLVARLLERAGVWRLSFSTHALTMAFNEGTRNEGLRLLAQITTHCPDRYHDMLKEAKE